MQQTSARDGRGRCERLAIVCTHPIQYYSPVFASLARRRDIDIKVFYGWRGLTVPALDYGFSQAIAWDIPLLDGYDYEFVENVARHPGSHHFRGIDLPTLTHAIDRWRADAVLIYGWRFNAHLQAMRYFKGRIPVLFRGDSTLLGERMGIRTWLRRRVLRWVYRYVDVALYVGSSNREYFLAHGLQPDQLVFAPHAVDNNRFSYNPDSEASADEERRQVNVEGGDIVFLFSGKLEPVKAPELLLKAFQTLHADKCHLLFAGSGPLERQLKSNAPANVRFFGFQNQSQMPRIYRMADLVVLPSRSETWGLAINEGMACGKPVVASDRVGAAVDLIHPGENGWIFKSGSEPELTAALRAAADKGRTGLAEMGQRSRSIISDWSIEKQVDGILTAMSLCRVTNG